MKQKPQKPSRKFGKNLPLAPSRKNGVHRLRARETGRTVYSVGFNSAHKDKDGTNEETPRGPPTGTSQLN